MKRTNWLPYNYEIWKSAGSNTTSLPIFVRVVYTVGGSNTPRFHIGVGTGVDANGNLTGTVAVTATAPSANMYRVWSRQDSRLLPPEEYTH